LIIINIGWTSKGVQKKGEKQGSLVSEKRKTFWHVMHLCNSAQGGRTKKLHKGGKDRRPAKAMREKRERKQ